MADESLGGLEPRYLPGEVPDWRDNPKDGWYISDIHAKLSKHRRLLTRFSECAPELLRSKTPLMRLRVTFWSIYGSEPRGTKTLGPARFHTPITWHYRLYEITDPQDIAFAARIRMGLADG